VWPSPIPVPFWVSKSPNRAVVLPGIPVLILNFSYLGN
jgi:hypothetical protein